MEIKKEAAAQPSGTPTPAQLESINALAKGNLTAEQVYVFSLRLCDDRIDRDFERFDPQALPELARLFVGKTGITDHRWVSSGQVARIFAAETVREEDCSFIKAWAYIRRGGEADEIIADIEAGIKKEVSVGCAMGSQVCSICGAEYGTCGHQKGEQYDGNLCCTILRDPIDAYEFSFVAVPAQREAGVLKAAGRTPCLKELAEEFGAQAEYRRLHEQAELGRQYAKQMRDQVVRLCLSLELGMPEPILREAAGKLGTGELLELKNALEARAAKRFPGQPQLPARQETGKALESGYLI